MAQTSVRAGQVDVPDLATAIVNEPVAQAALATGFLPLGGGTLTGELIICYPTGDPCIWFKDIDFPCDSGGLWRILVDNDSMSVRRNTSPTCAFATETIPIEITSLSLVSTVPVTINHAQGLVLPLPNETVRFTGPNGSIQFQQTGGMIQFQQPGIISGVIQLSTPTIPIEIVALELKSVAPIRVTHTGTNDPYMFWDHPNIASPNGLWRGRLTGADAVTFAKNTHASGNFSTELVALTLTSTSVVVPLILDKSSTKIINVASGTATGDALHFGQIGAQVQAWDTDLDAIAALTAGEGQFIVRSTSAWVASGRCRVFDGTVITTTATATVVKSIVVPSGDVLTFTVRGHGYQSSTGDTFSRVLHGTIKNFGGTTSIVATNTNQHTANDAGAAAWTITAVANNTTDVLEVTVMGEAAKTIAWHVCIEVTEGG